jgi:hypothetical protein
MRGTWWEGSFTGDPEGYAKYGSGNGCLFPLVSRSVEHGGRSFSRTFERRVKFLFYQQKFYEEFERHVKEGSGNRQLSP